MTRVQDLFDLPDQVRKGDFVVKLSEGVQHPQETTDTYVVTPALVDAFDRALGLVGGALGDGRSQAAYLHGSFGSGKSHFMALLSLLLDGTEAAWRKSELHALRAKHGFVGKAKLLQLHFHMIAEESIERAIFGTYVEWVQKHHPDAPIPALFADEGLFADARRMLDRLGDERFFAHMNEGAAASEGWGDLATGWDRERFERAAASNVLETRAELFNALVKAWFQAWAEESRAFVDIDSGLAVLAGHARKLGYDGVVLFLDELILWLAHRASDSAWLHNEVQKMVKLVEAQDTARALPLVSFIARQRSLVEMCGKDYAGAEAQRLAGSLEHWEGRYDTIALEDRNLPAIIERRMLRPKSDEAKKALDSAFETLKRSAGASWQTLLGQQDAEAFRKLYPFSPALVEALVALSSSLQRQRTALKLLMELLVEHIDDLMLGEVVRVGDLFDVLAGSEEPADGVMRARFKSAKDLYKQQLLPIIRETHGTNTLDRCQRMRDGHPIRLGCSSCGEKACRTDNRLIKTLIVAALVPEVPALKDLTASRLAQLNHGTLKVPIAGTEGAQVAGKLRQWASVIGQVHVGNQTDPSVRIQLEGVDLGPILERYRSSDTAGSRQRVLRDLLFDALGVEKVADWGIDQKVEWRGTKRPAHLRFANVRKLGGEQLRCPDSDALRVIVDYPFDDPGHGPNEDVEVCERFMEESGGSWTLVWLPHFFSASVNNLLGELTILEHVLSDSATKRQAVADLSTEHQSRALNDLENLRNQKKSRILNVLEQAYGLATAREGDLDPSASVAKHLMLLKPGATLQAPAAAQLADALDAYARAALDARWPRHPKFSSAKPLTKARIDALVEKFGEIVDATDKRIAADKALTDEMRLTLQELGLVRVTEGAVHLIDDLKLQEIERSRLRKSVDAPTAAEVRDWLDEAGKMGLERGAEDLVVRCYARWAQRTFSLYGKAFFPKPGQDIPDDVVLEKPDLPSASDWEKALGLAGHTFGLSLGGRALHADNLKRFETAVEEHAGKASQACSRLVTALSARRAELGLGDTDREKTARSADGLWAGLRGKSGLAQVELLASFVAETSPRAVGASIATAAATADVLSDDIIFNVFAALRSQRATLGGAAELLERVERALRQDEINEQLAPRLRELAVEGQRLLTPRAPTLEEPGRERQARQITGSGQAAVRALRESLAELEQKVGAHGEDVMVSGQIEVSWPKKP